MVDRLFSEEESLLSTAISTDGGELETASEDVKGVVFILENIKKMKKARKDSSGCRVK